MFGKNKIKKVINIEGMSCMHCVKKVENELKALKQVKSVKVDLENKKAEVVLKEDIENKILQKSIEEIGFEVKNIEG